MYKPIHFLIRNRNFSTGIFFIRNKEFPICSNCLHFIERTNNYPYDGDRCKKFGEMDLITGAIKYDIAATCRLIDSNCGKNGLQYTAKNKTPSTPYGTCGNTEFITEGSLPTPTCLIGSSSLQS